MIKDKIKKVLDRHESGQGNLGSDSFRDMLATEISCNLNEHDQELSQEYLDHWTCDICGDNTHEVDYDYIGTGTNHLGCELKEEIKDTPNDMELGSKVRLKLTDESCSTQYIPPTIFGDGFIDNNKYDDVLPGEQLELWPEMTSWIYESPDGKTIYKRKQGEDYKSRRIVEDWELEKLNIQRKYSQ